MQFQQQHVRVEANMIQHDAVLDYYGRRLATCSSDKTIKIFEVEGDKHTLVETLRGYVIANRTAQETVGELGPLLTR